MNSTKKTAVVERETRQLMAQTHRMSDVSECAIECVFFSFECLSVRCACVAAAVSREILLCIGWPLRTYVYVSTHKYVCECV